MYQLTWQASFKELIYYNCRSLIQFKSQVFFNVNWMLNLYHPFPGPSKTWIIVQFYINRIRSPENTLAPFKKWTKKIQVWPSNVHLVTLDQQKSSINLILYTLKNIVRESTTRSKNVSHSQTSDDWNTWRVD